MMTDSEIIRDADRRINNVLNISRQKIEVKVVDGTYSVSINEKRAVGFDSTDDVITYLDGFETALECINDSKKIQSE